MENESHDNETYNIWHEVIGVTAVLKEVRKELELEVGMPLEIISFKDGIFIRKFEEKKND